jgi:hypothetical protein
LVSVCPALIDAYFLCIARSNDGEGVEARAAKELNCAPRELADSPAAEFRMNPLPLTSAIDASVSEALSFDGLAPLNPAASVGTKAVSMLRLDAPVGR